MHPRKIALLFILLLSGYYLMAQNRIVTGRVLDDKDKPVANASVTIRGTSQGTTTNDEGQFSLTVPASATIVVSSINFTTSELNVTGNDAPVVHLRAADKALSEVVVVAYGTQKRSEITSSISTVNAEAIKNQQVTSVGQALQGTAPGVQVVNENGQPGANPIIRIRGVASILASADPLIVVDGIVFDGNLNMINPNDIDNFSILKDATASALYGSRAANGVILINTKIGRRNSEASITLNSLYGISSRAIQDYKYLNTQQHFELGWEAFKNYFEGEPDPEQLATDNLVESGFRYNPYGPNFSSPVGTDGKLVAGAVPLWNDDWTKELTRKNAARRDVNLGIGGGTDKSRYYFSLGYLNQDGYVSHSGYERVSTRFNYTNDLKDWLQVGARVSIISSKQNYPDQGTNDFADVIAYTRTMSSVFPIYQHDDKGVLIKDADGNPVFDYGKPSPSRDVNVNRPVLQPTNEVATLALDDWNYKRLLTDVNAYAQINFTKNLYFKSSFGINRNNVDQLNFQNRIGGDAESVGGRVYREQDLTTSWTWNNMLAFEQHFGDHHIEAMASYEAYKYNFQLLSGTKSGFPYPGEEQPTNGATLETFDGYINTSTLLSYLGRVKYDYKGKYFAEVTARRDAASVFAPGFRNGWFPAAGVSWLMSEEEFIKSRDWISMLKLRVSYGSLGNNNLTDLFPYLKRYSTGYNDLNNPGVYLTNLANIRIQWERQLASNIGIDFGFFKNRLSGSVDLFDKSSKKLLYNQPLAPSIGFSNLQTNIGKLQNRGVELNLDYAIIRQNKLNWNVMFNVTYLKNKIVSLLPGLDTAASSGAFRRVVGKSIYEFYMPQWAGVNKENGEPLWWVNEKDANGNNTGKKITTNDYSQALENEEWVGSGLPKFTGGLTTRLKYLNFDLNILFNYAFGGKYYDLNYSNLMHGVYYGFGSQMSVDELKRWSKPGDVTNVPKLDINNGDALENSTRFLYSGDYIRLRNVTLGYTFDPGNKQKVFKNIRLYLQADNYFTWDKLERGSDPESSINGYANSNAWPLKTISAGLDLTF